MLIIENVECLCKLGVIGCDICSINISAVIGGYFDIYKRGVNSLFDLILDLQLYHACVRLPSTPLLFSV